MKNTDLRAKARAIFGPAIAEPMPKQPNGAKALQQRANARPIPTYKVGGPVKKMPTPGDSVKSGNRMSKQEGDEMRFMDMMEKKKRPMPSPAASAASGNRMSRQEGAEMKKMKMAMGGKVAPTMEPQRPAVTSKKGSPQPKVAPKMGGIGAGLFNKGQSPSNSSQATASSKLANALSAMRSGNVGNLGKQPQLRQPGFVDTMPRATVPSGPPPAGMAPVDPRKAAMMKKGGKVQTASDTARKLATEMGGMKKGGKVKQVDVDMKMLEEMSRPKMSLPNLESRVAEARSVNTARAKETSDAAKGKSFKEAFNEARKEQGPNGVFTWRGNTYNTKMAGESPKAGRAAAAPSRGDTPAAAPAVSNRGNPPAAATGTPAAPAAAQTGSGTPPASTTVKPARAAAPVRPQVGLRNTDLGSYFADILDKERAANAASNKKLVERYKSEGRPRLAKIVSMLSGAEYAKGGKVKAEKTKEAKPKNGLAVMIAIGKPMKPAKKMNGGPMGYMDGGEPMGYAAGGAGKMRKGQAPIKKAQGGAAKVRKGMMSPEGNIIDAMNKMRGK
jgi:hypothetical protein